MIRLIPIFICAFLGALLLTIPDMTRRGVLFAINVPPDFRDTARGRQAISTYRALIAFTLFIDLAAIALAPEGIFNVVFVAGPIPLLLVAAAGFLWQRQKLAPFAVKPVLAGVREAVLSSEPDRLPWFGWLGAFPFACFAAATAYLNANWDLIPARFPVHWDTAGRPNGWSERTAHGVYSPLIFATELCAFLLVLALAGWFGARRSDLRRTVLGTMIAVDCMMGLMFSEIAVNPLLHLPIAAIIFPPLGLMAIILFVSVRRVEQSGETVESTPEEFWHGQMFYYNPGDPSLLVEKRFGMGYTLNFGNRWSWVLAGSLVAIIVSIRPLLL